MCACVFSQDAPWTAQLLRGRRTSTVKDTMDSRMETTGLKRRSLSLQKDWDAQKDKSVSFFKLDHVILIMPLAGLRISPQKKKSQLKMKDTSRKKLDLFNILIVVNVDLYNILVDTKIPRMDWTFYNNLLVFRMGMPPFHWLLRYIHKCNVFDSFCHLFLSAGLLCLH